ncbi:MAG TPA: glutamate-1-semialdehyde 2,1-aminomutase, partial [Polyangiaceae bacterium]|nr:glutamate-1-semialdehyde 2,1-aminomutase [Polyangiaceae bacterium]
DAPVRVSESGRWFARAQARIPGGVNSPVRAFGSVGGEPFFVARALGSRIVDTDGREYLDYVQSWGASILGHAHPKVVERVEEVAKNGLSFGAPTEAEVRFAEVIVERYPSIAMLRCVSSGTEATMSALRLARGFTGRDVIVKFDGAYHGHSDSLLVKAGSGAATFGNPDSAGVPSSIVENTATLPYNDLAALHDLFNRDGARIAAVIVEPVAGNMGCVPPQPQFLETILELCARHGALSIFDEVMTGCRVARGGAQGLFGMTPDLTCLGKVVGGGLPLAVYGGRADVMQKVAPLGPVYQAGTLSGNPIAVNAGLATLAELTDASYQRLETLGLRLQTGLERILRETATPGVVQRVGSMLTLFFHRGPVRSWLDAAASDTKRFGVWHRGLVTRGVYWPPSQFEAAFISLEHTEEDIDQTIEAALGALGE